MKFLLLLFSSLFILISCSPSKPEAIEYLVKIRYGICDEVIYRLDENSLTLSKYLSNPSNLTKGPSAEEHMVLLTEQKAIIPILEDCIEELKKIDFIGDNSMLLERSNSYMNSRLELEKGTMLKFVEILKDGATNDELIPLNKDLNKLISLRKSRQKFDESETNFLKEFEINDNEIDEYLNKIGY